MLGRVFSAVKDKRGTWDTFFLFAYSKNIGNKRIRKTASISTANSVFPISKIPIIARK